MEYISKLDKIIDDTAEDREIRNTELFEYSRNRFLENYNLEDEGKDSVSKLPGLRAFFYEAGEVMAANRDKHFGAIVMDIADFKAINELCGRKGGDELIFLFSAIFTHYQKVRLYTIAGHARADNFVLCTAFENEQELVDIVEDMYKIITNYQFPFKIQPSFGICADYSPRPSASYLKDCATLAMKSIKGKFYAYYAIYNEDMRRQLLREKQIESDIINALNNNQLKLYIQPKVDMRSGKIYGGESLIRWIHPEIGMISPGDFIPVLEKNGFIINVDYFIWEQVFIFLSELKKEGKPLIPISVNISRVHVHDRNFCDYLIDLSKKYDIDPKFVPLELTESAFSDYEEVMYERMDFLRNNGFNVSMDDFGTGYSSLTMLANQPLDEIKIDRSFIIKLENPKSKIILEDIITMLKNLQMQFIVEGVENSEQKDLLLEYGCYNAQGFMFHRPMPAEDFKKLLFSNE